MRALIIATIAVVALILGGVTISTTTTNSTTGPSSQVTTPEPRVTVMPHAQTAAAGTPTPAETMPSPEFRPPAEIQDPLTEDKLRSALIDQRQGLCDSLQLIGGIIISTGVLSDVPPAISEMAGMPIPELEAMETGACQRQQGELPDENKSTTELLNEARTVEWLVQMHLAAMDRVLMQNPNYRPINAEGSFRAFFEMHNISLNAMRDSYLALSEDPTLDDARQVASFYQDSLVLHAQAEDQTLWPLAKSVGDSEIAQSAVLLEAEHRTIDEGIASYMDTLLAVEQGQAQLDELIPIARNVRIRTELHFAKEEQSVVRLLQERISSEQFEPVVEEIDQSIGPWLRDRGWQWSPQSGSP